MKSKLIIFFFISSVYFSCESNTEKSDNNIFTFKDFPKKEILNGKNYFYPEILVPMNILFKEGKLIVSDKSGLAIMHRIDASSMKYETELGQIGWGPGEIPNVGSFDTGLNSNTFWVYSGMGKMLAEYDLLDSSKLFINSIKQKENWFVAVRLVFVDMNSFLGFMISEDDQFVLFDSLGTKLQRFGKWSEVMPELSGNPFLISDLHQGGLFGNPSKGVFALAGIKTDRIEIIKINENSIKSVKGPVNHFPEYKINRSNGEEVIIVDSSSQILTYNSGYVGESHIYLAYIGKNRKQLINEEYVKNILVLDFDGKPIVHYELDISILNMSVDEKNRKIYGTTIGEEPGIVVFDY